jgi:hypothetical protein
MEATYAIGKTAPKALPAKLANPVVEPPSTEPPATVQIYPYDVLVKTGDKVTFSVRLYDAHGRFIREEKAATWAVDQLGGAVGDGVYTAGSAADAGYVKATVGSLTGQARVRVVPPLPWTFDFDQTTGEAPPKPWLNTTGKFVVRELDGNKVLQRLPDATPQRRSRMFMGPITLSNYTIEADVRVTEKRRQMSDVGVFAQRYGLVLFGNSQKLELEPWQAAAGRTATVPFQWKPDAWYHVKLQVQNEAGGVTVAHGKVWPRGETEPAAWTVEKRDTIGHREGAPGLYADPANEIYFDNLKVTANQ